MSETISTAKRVARRDLYPLSIECVITTHGVLHGQAPEGDAYAIDLRTALRNPHNDPAMRQMTGLDQAVFDHVMATPGAEKIVADAVSRIASDLTHWSNPRGLICFVQVFCKGGRHRSVAIAEEVADRLYELGFGVEVEHRDIAKPVVQAVPAAEPVGPCA